MNRFAYLCRVYDVRSGMPPREEPLPVRGADMDGMDRTWLACRTTIGVDF